MKKKVLIPIHLNTYFNELHRVAQLLQASDQYEPIIVFPHNYPTRQRDIDRCLEEGFSCLDHHGQHLSPPVATRPAVAAPTKQSAKELIKSMIRRLGLMPLAEKIYSLSDVNNRRWLNVIGEIIYVRSRIRFTRRLYRQQHIQLVILGGDAVHYDTSSFIRGATLEHIPSVIVPCTMSNAEEMAESYWPIKKYHLTRWPNRVFAKLYPHWVYVHKDRPLLRLPAEQALAMEILKIAPPRPWMNLSGYANVIATESEAMVEYYTRDGIPRNQLEVTGSLADDELFRAQQNAVAQRLALYQRHALDPQKPMLLTALPPDQLYMEGGRPECEFQTYPELLDFWLAELGKIHDYQVIVNLHPSVNHADYAHLEKYGVTISQESAASLMPLADIFLASVSTIIRWAILCGKPVINYDVYRFRYHDYTGVPGVLLVETKADFKTMVHHLTHDQAFYRRVQADQAAQAKRWGMLDGHVGQRLLDVFDRLTNPT